MLASKRVKNKTVRYVGIDGEGMGRDPHRYVLLAAGDEHGRHRWYTENADGLTTDECLRFIVNLPTRNTRIYAYSFNYDLTKILADLDNERLYRLFRPELRTQKKNIVAWRVAAGPAAICWHGFSLNLVGSKFTVAYKDRKVTIWDIWKFYQGKFVTALIDWKIGTGEDQQSIERMKELRAVFEPSHSLEVREYCFSEVRHLAMLAHKLVTAHEDAGLKLTSFYGAGSTASAMLKLMGIREALRPTPTPMLHAVASAFFGGRFENSVLGEITEPVKNWDISSAYPYQMCFLPCLIHGTWKHTFDRNRLESARAACVEYTLCDSNVGKIEHWAPFPFRGGDGSICFPSRSGGGWVWLQEFLAGERYCEKYPGAIKFMSAWVYESKCDCKPFAKIPYYYLERCRIGKEGAGIVFKLGPNSGYGKLAQSVGSAIFQSWIWAGLITSGCRAQLLDLMNLFEDRSKILMLATDGLFGIGDGIFPPAPRDTGTSSTGKPLGGWECGDIPQGIFAARPGIYFPLRPTKADIKKIKGRGVGKGTILDNWKSIVESWRAYGVNRIVTVKNIERFCGGKTSISYSPVRNEFTRAAGGIGTKGQDLPKYGDWIGRRVEMSFDPMPKREGILPDGIHLKLRRMDPRIPSAPYSKALRSRERVALEQAVDEAWEQPDGDLSDTWRNPD